MAEHIMYQRLTLFSAAILLIFTSCGFNDFDELQLPENKEVMANIDIAMLRGLGVRLVDIDCVVRGCVTAEDRSGNFHRSFMLQDATGAMEIRAGFYDLNTIFPRGSVVVIRAKNLAVGTYGGVLQLGRADGQRIDFIANRYFPDSFFYPQNRRCEVMPRKLSIAKINDEYCGELVRIEDLQSADTVHATWAGERVFIDGNGDEIRTVTSEYSRFANDTIPRETVSLTGILLAGNRLKLRDRGDVEM